MAPAVHNPSRLAGHRSYSYLAYCLPPRYDSPDHVNHGLKTSSMCRLLDLSGKLGMGVVKIRKRKLRLILYCCHGNMLADV